MVVLADSESTPCKSMKCGNTRCGAVESEKWCKGWVLRNGGPADLCFSCSKVFEEHRFCETFHHDDDGWRSCLHCRKRLHCGCVAAVATIVLLDHGGVKCRSCRQEKIVEETHKVAKGLLAREKTGMGSAQPAADTIVAEEQFQRGAVKVKFLFEKLLSPTDAKRNGRLVVPKAGAEAFFPKLKRTEGIPLDLPDIETGRIWRFQYRFWGSTPATTMYFLEGVTPFLNALKLREGDTVTFNRQIPGGGIVLGARRALGRISGQDKKRKIRHGSELEQNGTARHKSNSMGPEYSSSDDMSMDKDGREVLEASAEHLGTLADVAGMEMDCPKASKLSLAYLQARPSLSSTITVVDGFEIEEFEEAPIVILPLPPAVKTLRIPEKGGAELDQWVQCDNCSKWRRVPTRVTIPHQWDCSQNLWDSSRNSCHMPEEELTDENDDSGPGPTDAGKRGGDPGEEGRVAMLCITEGNAGSDSTTDASADESEGHHSDTEESGGGHPESAADPGQEQQNPEHKSPSPPSHSLPVQNILSQSKQETTPGPAEGRPVPESVPGPSGEGHGGEEDKAGACVPSDSREHQSLETEKSGEPSSSSSGRHKCSCPPGLRPPQRAHRPGRCGLCQCPLCVLKEKQRQQIADKRRQRNIDAAVAMLKLPSNRRSKSGRDSDEAPEAIEVESDGKVPQVAHGSILPVPVRSSSPLSYEQYMQMAGCSLHRPHGAPAASLADSSLNGVCLLTSETWQEGRASLVAMLDEAGAPLRKYLCSLGLTSLHIQPQGVQGSLPGTRLPAPSQRGANWLVPSVAVSDRNEGSPDVGDSTDDDQPAVPATEGSKKKVTSNGLGKGRQLCSNCSAVMGTASKECRKCNTQTDYGKRTTAALIFAMSQRV